MTDDALHLILSGFQNTLVIFFFGAIWALLLASFLTLLPLVVGEMKVLLRATSYAGYIAQKDLVKAVDSIRAQTEDVFALKKRMLKASSYINLPPQSRSQNRSHPHPRNIQE